MAEAMARSFSESGSSFHDLLRLGLERFGRRGLAEELGVDERTLRRWERPEAPPSRLHFHALRGVLAVEREHARRNLSGQFTFVDLFAGIGGTRLAFQRAGGRCVFTCERDRHARQTYRANFVDDFPIHPDIRRITTRGDGTDRDAEEIDALVPDHDVLVAGFPCQPFSIAGVSKKRSLGQADGFLCQAQGTLFFDLARILEAKKPLAFLLENVKNLKSHDGGRTYDVIRGTLEALGYCVHDRVIDATGYVPQHRERIYLVGFRESVPFDWGALAEREGAGPRLGEILHPEDGSEAPEPPYTLPPSGAVNRKYVLSARLWQYLKDYAAKHRERGNGFGYGLVTRGDVARTLSARYYKDGSEILVSRGPRRNPRRLTPRECARLMGFPDTFTIPVSDTQAYRQFGNSVVVPVVEEVARLMVPHVRALQDARETGVRNLALF